MKVIKYLIIIVLLILLSCNISEKKSIIGNDVYKEKINCETVNENFEEFLLKFKQDSLFRVSRVKFPLKGFNSDEREMDSRDTLFIWNKEEFNFYTYEVFNNQQNNLTKEKIINIGELYQYRTFIEDSGYDVNYKFKLINNEWYLIYFSYKNF